MPAKKTSYVDLLNDWEILLRTCSANEERLPCLKHCLAPLEALLREMKELRETRSGLYSATRRFTRNLREVREEGRESARRLRSLVKAHLGTRSEELAEFGIAPIRPRRKGK